MIEAEHLGMHYGSVQALSEASFTANRGEILGLLGPNGAGKSTLMKILTTYLYPTSGTARVHGMDVREKAAQVRKHIGYLPETLPLYRDMEVGEYLRFVGRGRGLDGKTLSKRLNWSLERAGLVRMLRRPIRELSKGYQQRTALAQAIIHDPDVLILDEPTTGLDPHQILEIRQLISDLAADKTILFSTHILQEVEAIADRVVIISQGRIAAQGTLDELAAQARTRAEEWITVAAEAGEAKTAMENCDHVESVLLQREEGGYVTLRLLGADQAAMASEAYQLVRDKGWDLRELRQGTVSLEDVFLSLTGALRESTIEPISETAAQSANSQ